MIIRRLIAIDGHFIIPIHHFYFCRRADIGEHPSSEIIFQNQ